MSETDFLANYNGSNAISLIWKSVSKRTFCDLYMFLPHIYDQHSALTHIYEISTPLGSISEQLMLPWEIHTWYPIPLYNSFYTYSHHITQHLLNIYTHFDNLAHFPLCS